MLNYRKHEENIMSSFSTQVEVNGLTFDVDVSVKGNLDDPEFDIDVSINGEDVNGDFLVYNSQDDCVEVVIDVIKEEVEDYYYENNIAGEIKLHFEEEKAEEKRKGL